MLMWRGRDPREMSGQFGWNGASDGVQSSVLSFRDLVEEMESQTLTKEVHTSDTCWWSQLNALVRRHARLAVEKPRLLRLDATQQQRGFSRELPSIYLFSVWKEKCVAGK